jgi:hypothetical protein
MSYNLMASKPPSQQYKRNSETLIVFHIHKMARNENSSSSQARIESDMKPQTLQEHPGGAQVIIFLIFSCL